MIKPMIRSFESVVDSKMVVDELLEELLVFDNETNQKLFEMLCSKKIQIQNRYDRRFD